MPKLLKDKVKFINSLLRMKFKKKTHQTKIPKKIMIDILRWQREPLPKITLQAG
jgi:hypothetical protein